MQLGICRYDSPFIELEVTGDWTILDVRRQLLSLNMGWKPETLDDFVLVDGGPLIDWRELRVYRDEETLLECGLVNTLPTRVHCRRQLTERDQAAMVQHRLAEFERHFKDWQKTARDMVELEETSSETTRGQKTRNEEDWLEHWREDCRRPPSPAPYLTYMGSD